MLWSWVSEAERSRAWSAVEVTPLSPGRGGDAVEAGATRAVGLAEPIPARMEERLVSVVPAASLVYILYTDKEMQR